MSVREQLIVTILCNNLMYSPCVSSVRSYFEQVSVGKNNIESN